MNLLLNRKVSHVPRSTLFWHIQHKHLAYFVDIFILFHLKSFIELITKYLIKRLEIPFKIIILTYSTSVKECMSNSVTYYNYVADK